MSDSLLHHDSSMRAPKPLVVRGGLGRTFGSLISFLALTLLAGGSYLLEDGFAHPVDAHAAALITAAFAIALGVLLLFYLCKPRKTGGARRIRARSAPRRADAFPRASSVIRRKSEPRRRDLAYQRLYVDHSIIRR